MQQSDDKISTLSIKSDKYLFVRLVINCINLCEFVKFQSHIPSNKLPVLNFHRLKGAEYCQLFKNIYSANIPTDTITCYLKIEGTVVSFYHGILWKHLLILYLTQNHLKHFLKRNRFCRPINAALSGMLEIHSHCSLPIFPISTDKTQKWTLRASLKFCFLIIRHLSSFLQSEKTTQLCDNLSLTLLYRKILFDRPYCSVLVI